MSDSNHPRDSLFVTEGIDILLEWVFDIEGIVPPLSVEVVLGDGSRYSLHSVIHQDQETGTALLRVWDFRGFSDEELERLRERLREIEDRSVLADPKRVHLKLDWANIRIRVSDISHCIEWPDELWPERDRPHAPAHREIGFGRTRDS